MTVQIPKMDQVIKQACLFARTYQIRKAKTHHGTFITTKTRTDLCTKS